MAPADRALFGGGDEIDAEELAKLQILNKEEAVDEALKQFGWDGKGAGCIVLQLCADNSAATSGQFLVRGTLASEEFKTEAAKIWSSADAGLQLSINIPAGGNFKFSEGGMCSDFMGMEEIEHCITTGGRNGQVVMHADYDTRGVGNFCIRLVCHLQKAKSKILLGYTILLYPGSTEEVLEVSELAKSASWPGLKLVEGEMPLIPAAKSPWRCPTLPLLLTGTPWEDEMITPTAEEMRAKIGAIMSTSEPGEACKTRKALMTKWRRYANAPDEFTPRKGPMVWPPQQRAIQTGRPSADSNKHVSTVP
jgi:hypothetical protein